MTTAISQMTTLGLNRKSGERHANLRPCRGAANATNAETSLRGAQETAVTIGLQIAVIE
jgi:hypothetical protein